MNNALIYFALWFYYKTEGDLENAAKAGEAFEIECSADFEVLEAMGWDKEYKE